MHYTHGDNLNQKLTSSRKYKDENSIKLLQDILPIYEKWKSDNINLKGPYVETSENDLELLTQRVKLFEEYKTFIDAAIYAVNFDSRSNLHSSVLEEFLYYLFRDLVEQLSKNALIGKSHSFKDIFFMPTSYKTMLEKTHAKIEIKDHDFVIGTYAISKFKTQGSSQEENINFELPAIAIECKTYLDKTMLEGASTAADQLKVRNPNALYFVVAEWLKLTENINIGKYKVDQIYILRKQKNVDREFRLLPGYMKNPVYADVVEHLFNTVRDHLTSDWSGGVKDMLTKGYIDRT
jgi:hypothetical protein